MAKDRLFFILSVAFLGILAAFLFRESDEEGISIKQKKEVIEKQVMQVMVVQQNINAGDRLTPEKYTWKTIDTEDPNPSLVLRDKTIEKWINDAVAVKDIPAGEQIKRLDIMWPEEKENNDVALAPNDGKKAIVFHSKNRLAVLQFLSPGMYVDVIFTSDTKSGSSESKRGFGSLTFTLLKNIRILAIGNVGSDLGSNSAKDVLLEMTGRQAEVFSYAEQVGILSLGLIHDDAPSETEKNSFVEMLLTSQSAGNFNSILTTHIIRSLFPNVDVNITATQKGYIASGTVHDPQVADKIKEILVKLSENGEKDVVDLMKVVPQQVLICVKVFEVLKTYESRLGVNWEALYKSGEDAIALTAVFPRPPSGVPNYFFDGKGTAGDFSLSTIVDLLKEKGKGRILAEPNLTTISGKTAHFFAGGEFPILIPQGGALLGTVTVEYKKFGVILDFTPTVDINGLITLHVFPEVSNIDKNNSVTLQGFELPALVTRNVETTVKLWPGQSYAIAGLLQYETVSKVSSLCGLNRLPIIGPLFNSRAFLEQRTELMFLITPYLIYSDKEGVNIKEQ